MKRKILIINLVLFTFLSPLFCQNENSALENISSENFVGKHIISFDLSTIGLSNKELGWGFGINYEQQIIRFLAVKCGFNHWMMFPFNNDFTNIINVGIKLETIYYPFGNGLDKLYIGLGGGTEFIMYNGENIPSEHNQDTPISLIGQIGWKQNLWNYLMMDIFCGYRYVLNPQNIYEPAKKYVDQGFQYGIRFKFNLSKIFTERT